MYAELVERSPSASFAEVQELCSSHPELAHELRGLHAVRGLLDDLGGAVSAGGETDGMGSESSIPPELAGFQIVRLVGRGGMGEVWEALDLTLGRRVALKLLSPFAAHSPRQNERLRREALTVARLNHPNIVALFSTGEHAGRPYLVQELIEGGRSLREEIEELRRLGAAPEGYERVVAHRFAALADALALAHAAGIVHRDVKPHNVLLGPDGTPKVADFGLAKTVGDASLSRTGEFVGTYLYASPEQVSEGRLEVGPASDVFSLGATLYECLTLERPFAGDDLQAITRAILHADPVDPRALRPRVERDLAVICLHALEKRPEARYENMAELRDDLYRWLNGEPIRARPPSLARRLQRAVLRHPTAATAIACAAAAFLAILFFLGRTERARGELQAANVRLRESNTALEVARQEAQTEADTSAEVVSFLSELFHSGDPLVYGSRTPTIKEVILEGAERLRSGEVKDQQVRARLASDLGMLLSRLGHWDEATQLLSEACELWHELGQEDSALAVEARGALAILYRDQGRTAECRALLEPLIEHLRSPNELSGTARLTLLAAAGQEVSETGDLVRGEALVREALALAPMVEVKSPIPVQIARCSLGICLLRQGRLDEAAAVLEPLCAELEPMLATGSTIALESFSMRARLRLRQGRLQEGLDDYLNALHAAEANLDHAHPRCVNLRTNLATAYIDMQRWQEAEDMLFEGLEISTQHQGEDSLEARTALLNLATVWNGMGRFAEAEELMRSLVEKEVAQHGETHLRTALARANLAICLFNLGRAQEALEVQELALQSTPPGLAERAYMERSLEIYRRAVERQ